jgi:PAS domain S-box-containing protein
MPQQKKKKDPKGNPAPAFRILIVDDTKENRYLLESMFGAKGYMTESAANGIEAQGHLKKEHFDVIISDLLMPKMDGFQLLRECKKDPLLNKIPFIIYTATYTDKKDIEFGLSLGAARYIIKPAEPEVLLYQLDEIIKQSTEEVVEEPGSTIEDNRKFDKEYIRHVTAKLDKKILDLEKSEERYRTLAEASPDQIFIVGKDDTIKFANTALLKLFRLPYDQVVGTPRKNLFPPDIADSQSIHFKKVFETGEMLKTEERIQFGTQEFWIDTSLVPLKDKTGNVTAVLGVSRDITDRKRAQEALRKLNAELEQRVQERTAELRQIEWLLTKRTEPQLRGDGLRKVAAQPYGDLTQLNRCRLMLDSVGADVLTDIVGDYLDLLDTSAAVYEKNGDYALGIFTSGWCQFMDLAARNVCGTADNQEALACGKWLCHESCWTKASKASIETGQPTDIECEGGIHLYAVPIRVGGEVVGSINIGYGDPPRDPDKLRELAAKYGVSVEDLRRHAEAYQMRPPYIIEMAKHRLHASARLIGEMIERREAEKQQQALAAQLQETNKELEAFSYSVSHDLRSPLRAIDGFSRVLLEEYYNTLDEEGKRLLDVIRFNTQKMDQLITDLLVLSRVSRTGITFSRIDMTTLSRSIYHESASPDDQSKFDFSVAPLPDAYGDPTLMRQVWSNLLSNAIKFTMPKDARKIEIGGRTENGMNIYYVKDTGVGFNPDYTHKLFDLFQRLHKTEEFEGTGVGLAIVQRIIYRHGGQVWAEGKVNEGATFYFSLPDRQ